MPSSAPSVVPFARSRVCVHVKVSLFRHVLIAVRSLLCHHVHVTLESNRRLRFIALGSLLNDDYIVLLLIPVGVLKPLSS